MDISNANSDRIYQWVNNEPSDSYIKQEFPRGFELTSIISKNEQNLIKCPHCFLIPRYPLMLNCGHPSCHSCFPVFFKMNPICNYCRMPVDIINVMTLNDDRLFRPKSLTAEMYEDAVIRCSNTGCKLEFSIDEINKHEIF